MSDDLRPVRRALLSVSDRTGIVELARGLGAHGTALVATGSTAALLRAEGLAVAEVADVTGHPEILGGRVKTLHPRVHGGILARRGHGPDEADMAAHGIEPFDLVAVNLYPFEETAASGAPFGDVVERIDVGGPAMIRAAAKNHADVAVLTNPADYEALLAEVAAHGGTTGPTRLRLARAAFARTAAYDAGIAAWIAGDAGASRTLAMRLIRPLRYGENPHQAAALYAGGDGRAGVLGAEAVGGKELSFNNIADADAAVELAADIPEPACVIVKHLTPCGVGTGATLAQAHARALACDPQSAFGGVVAVNRPLDGPAAEAVAAVFTEVVAAPGADAAARAALARRPNLRLLVLPGLPDPRAPGEAWRQVAGGFLVQDRDAAPADPASWRVATRRAPDADEMRDLLLAWTVARHVRSNAIVLAANGATVGIGGGQTSRVDAVAAALRKRDAMERPPAAPVMASDAFFPFADGVALAARAGVRAVVQPGGSLRDAEVVAAADEMDLAMVFTHMRHFRH